MVARGVAAVTGPVAGGRRGWPFGGPMVDVARFGYREEEYFLEGAAARFAPVPGSDLGRDGRWQVEPADPVPYRTRFVVVRPEDPDRFNGTVVVYWNNVTAGYDAFGGGDSPEIFEGGYAYAAVSAQRVSVHGAGDNPMGLRSWDPDRYGSLSIPGDDHSFDIFSQVAGVVGPDRPRVPVDPMGGLDVRQLLAQGASQSAARLATYVNAIQPLAGVLDGFLLTLYFGNASPLQAGDAVVVLSSLDPASGAAPAELAGTHLLRDDLDVPVLVVNSECEATGHHPVRQPDTDRYRYWETAGTSHVSFPDLQGAAPRFERDLGFSIPVPPDINHVSLAPVIDAALHHLRAWAAGGAPPPSMPRIQFGGDPPAIARDEHGIARGGIRLPQVEVPVACNSALPRTPDAFARLAGSCDPFSRERLDGLYGTRAVYLDRFEEATRAAEKAGAILPRDAESLIATARTEAVLDDRS